MATSLLPRFRLGLALVSMGLAQPLYAAESLSFIAEHIIEVPMDFRFLALPQTPIDMTRPEWRIQGGYGLVTGGQMVNRLPMLSLQYYAPLSDTRGLSASFFYDELHLSGNSGDAIAVPADSGGAAIPPSFAVSVKSISGQGFHSGFSLAYVIRRDNNHRLQLGVGLQQLNISSFDVEFRTQGLSSDFDGKFDYAGVYNAYTPFFSYEWAPEPGFFGWIGHTRLIAAIPLPRTGFKERFVGAGVDTSSAAGKHIPDAFLGLGYSLEHPVSNWRIDVGAMIYSLVVEPVGHSDIETALLINLSKSW